MGDRFPGLSEIQKQRMDKDTAYSEFAEKQRLLDRERARRNALHRFVDDAPSVESQFDRDNDAMNERDR